ncbi:MAG: VWA domain-containing protein, partial [Thermoanaerobaculia bacterium]
MTTGHRWVCTWALLALAAADLEAARKIPEDLLPHHREWAEEVDILLTKEEWKTFLALQEPYQRDGFIERFWKARDPYPDTQRNEFKEAWDRRVDFARRNYGNLTEDRARLLLLNGEPDLHLDNPCPTMFLPVEFWFYREVSNYRHKFALIFYFPFGQKIPLLWRPSESVFDLLDTAGEESIFRRCPQTKGAMGSLGVKEDAYGGGIVMPGSGLRYDLECVLEQVKRCDEDADAVAEALAEIVRRQGELGFSQLLSRLERQPEPRDGEWLANLAAYSTDLPSEAETFPAELEMRYPGRQGSRTVVQGLLTVPAAAVSTIELAGRESYSFLLTGEVLRDEKLFESFRYRYDFGIDQIHGDEGGLIPLVFERLLRPASYELRLKVEDLHGDRFLRHVETIEVPRVDASPPAPPADAATARLLAEADPAFDDRRGKLQLVRPAGEMHLGMVRFDTLVSGLELAKVTFYVDGRPVLTKKNPPYSVEVDLGKVPRLHKVRVVGFDAGGAQVATDALQVNVGRHRFAVEIAEPRPGQMYGRSLMARARVHVPDSGRLDRLELYLNDDLVGTLYQPPFSQMVVLDGGSELAYVRAVAYLEDGNSTEAVVFINSPQLIEEIDVRLVEVYATVLDRGKRPVEGLTAGDFTVLEDGVPQTVTRFEQVRDLPVHAAILFDTSASMSELLPAARTAALDFFQQIVTPKDRVAFITFNDRPDLVAPFTNEIETLPEKLAVLAAERGTA